MRKRYVWLLSAVCLIGIGCKGKPQLPTGDTSTLPGTLQLIQDILNQSGETDFANHANGRTANVVFEITRAKGDVEKCGVGYHAKSTINGTVLFDRDGKIAFRQTETLKILTAEDYFKMADPNANPKVTPPTYVLLVQQDEAGRHSGQGDAFVFSDKAWAEALQNAISRAMTFCPAKK